MRETLRALCLTDEQGKPLPGDWRSADWLRVRGIDTRPWEWEWE